MNQRQIKQCIENIAKQESAQAPLFTVPKSVGFASFRVLPHLAESDVRKKAAEKFNVGEVQYYEYHTIDQHTFNQSRIQKAKSRTLEIQYKRQQLHLRIEYFHQQILSTFANQAELKDKKLMRLCPDQTNNQVKAILMTANKRQTTIHIDTLTVDSITTEPLIENSNAMLTYKTASNVRNRMFRLFENSVLNCERLLTIYKICRNLPCSLKEFMPLLNKLSTQDKENLQYLLNRKKCEIMFVYNPDNEDFIVGIRMRGDASPHPALIGKIDPTIVVGGTIDISFINNQVKITRMRGDSGHYCVGANNLELIGRYIQREIDPDYFGNHGFIQLRSYYGDPIMTQSLEIYPLTRPKKSL